jgi:hypothetical protein
MSDNWINLRHEGGENDPLAYVVVSVEIDGQRHEAIRELKGNYFDHSVNMDSLPVPLVPVAEARDKHRTWEHRYHCHTAALKAAVRNQHHSLESLRRCARTDEMRLESLRRSREVVREQRDQAQATIATLREAVTEYLAACRIVVDETGYIVEAAQPWPELRRLLLVNAAIDAGKETRNG